MAYRNIRLEQGDDGVATLTIARPDRLNALDAATVDELYEAVRETGRSGARCLMITGEGRGFSSGADLASAGGLPKDAGEALEKHFNPLIEALFELPLPLVAAVNGPAAGAGCSLALAADIVVAARSAYFLQAFVNIGLIPDAGATWLLPRLAGRARAMEMMMLGERVSAEQALDWGMISRVAEDDRLMAEAGALAARLAAGPTAALALIRRLARESQHLPLPDALAAEREAQREAGTTQDFRTGTMAFATKQPPRFQGR
jgi:2-(1,2-epoxy-1,2-dihydrophenyl)acetyl-CoA isomerase